MKPIYSIKRGFDKPIESLSDEECYILGWFFSDAAINYNKIRLRIQERDRKMLIKIKDYLGYSGPVGLEKRGTVGKLVQGCVCQDRATLNIVQKAFAKPVYDLYEVSGDHSKLFLSLSLAQQKSFLRGLMDGDGCVSYSTSSGMKFEMYWMVHPKFAALLSEWLQTYGFFTTAKIQNYRKPMVKLHVKGNSACLRLFLFLFSGAEIFLNRKFRKFVRLVRFKKSSKDYLAARKLCLDLSALR